MVGMQSNNLHQCPWPLASLVSIPVASMGVQVYLDLCLIFLLLCFSLHICFFPHFTCHGMVSQKMVLRSRDFILFNSCIIFHCMNIPYLCIHSSVDGQLDCIQFLNNGYNELCCCEHLGIGFCLNIVFHFSHLRIIPRCRIARLYDNSGLPRWC